MRINKIQTVSKNIYSITLVASFAFTIAANASSNENAQPQYAARNANHGGGHPHPGHPHAGHPHPGHPHPGHPHPGHPHPGHPHPGKPHHEKPHHEKAHPGNAHSRKPHTGQLHTGQPHTGQPHTGQPHTGQPHTGQPHSGQNNTVHPKTINQNIHHGQQPILHLNPVNPNLNKINPNNLNAHLAPLHTVNNKTPSHLSNTFTKNNIHNATIWNQQFTHKTINAQWIQKINGYQHHYHNQFYKNNTQRFNVYGHFWQNNHYHNWYSNWFKWGFYGGFWYPVRPFFAIDNYFTYPVVQWFFVDEIVTPEYYNTYYISEPPRPATCIGAFPYKHIYFPTDTLRDLLIEVSGFPQILRCNFRTDVINMTSQLQQDVSKYYAINFSFHQNDIVINYYQNLQNKAIVVAGFVNQGKINLAFEALLDLQNPNNSITFAPNGQNPTENQLQILNQLNNRIKSLGGDPFTAQIEPQVGDNGTQTPGTINPGSAPGP